LYPLYLEEKSGETEGIGTLEPLLAKPRPVRN